MTAALDVRRRLDWGSGGLRFTSLRVGGQWSRRSRDYRRRDRRAALRNEADGIAGLFDAAVPADVFSDLVGARPGPWIVSDFARVRAAFAAPGERADVVFRPGDLVATGTDLQNSYGVQERVGAAYARLDFEGSGAGLTWSGNAGLRLVRARTHVEGARMIDAQGRAEVRPVAHDSRDAQMLPSLNLAADFGDGRMLRLAASRSLTRPSLADLRASTVPASVLISAIAVHGQAAVDRPEPGVIFSGVGGNPALTPYLATNLDLSYEITGRRTSFSLAVFHKTIDDFIQTETATETLVFETRTSVAVQADVLMARPRNVGRAKIDGLEMGLHQRLPGGLGVWANATWTHSRLGNDERLTGVSDLAWSINPYLGARACGGEPVVVMALGLPVRGGPSGRRRLGLRRRAGRLYGRPGDLPDRPADTIVYRGDQPDGHARPGLRRLHGAAAPAGLGRSTVCDRAGIQLVARPTAKIRPT